MKGRKRLVTLIALSFTLAGTLTAAVACSGGDVYSFHNNQKPSGSNDFAGQLSVEIEGYSVKSGDWEKRETGELVSKKANSLVVSEDVKMTNGNGAIVATIDRPDADGDIGIVFGMDDDGMYRCWEDTEVSYYTLMVESGTGKLFLSKVDNGMFKWLTDGWWCSNNEAVEKGDSITVKIEKNFDTIYVYRYYLSETSDPATQEDGETGEWKLVFTHKDLTGALNGEQVGFRSGPVGTVFSGLAEDAEAELPERLTYAPKSGTVTVNGDTVISDSVCTVAVSAEKQLTNGNGTITATMKRVDGCDSSIIFGLDDMGEPRYYETYWSDKTMSNVFMNYYLLTLTGGKLAFAKITDDGWGWVNDFGKFINNDEIALGEEITVKIAKNGDSIYVYKVADNNGTPEDQFVFAYKDPKGVLRGNMVGFRSTGAGAEFRNLNVDATAVPEELKYAPKDGVVSIKDGTVTTLSDWTMAVSADQKLNGGNGTFTFELTRNASAESGVVFGLDDDKATRYFDDNGVSYYYLGFFDTDESGADGKLGIAKLTADGVWTWVSSWAEKWNGNDVVEIGGKVSLKVEKNGGTIVISKLVDEEYVTMFTYVDTTDNVLNGELIGFRSNKKGNVFANLIATDAVPKELAYGVKNETATISEDGNTVTMSAAWAVVASSNMHLRDGEGEFTFTMNRADSDSGAIFAFENNGRAHHGTENCYGVLTSGNVLWMTKWTGTSFSFAHQLENCNVVYADESVRTCDAGEDITLKVRKENNVIKVWKVVEGSDDILLITCTDNTGNVFFGNQIGFYSAVAESKFMNLNVTWVPDEKPLPYAVKSGEAKMSADGRVIVKSTATLIVSNDQKLTDGNGTFTFTMNRGIGDTGAIFGLDDGGLENYWEQGMSYYGVISSGDMIWLAKWVDGAFVWTHAAGSGCQVWLADDRTCLTGVDITLKVTKNGNNIKVYRVEEGKEDVLLIDCTDNSDSVFNGNQIGFKSNSSGSVLKSLVVEQPAEEN